MKTSFSHLLGKFDSNRLIHSLKTATAFLLGMFLVQIIHFPEKQWVLISILVVMCAQSRVGAILQKSYMRFLGTVLGASIAALTLWLAYPHLVWVTLILCLTTALFSYIADSPSYISEAGPLGAVTTVIILMGFNPTYAGVVSRFLEINLGIVIALLVSRFIWPLHSSTRLRQIVVNTFQDIKKLTEQLPLLPEQKAQKKYEQFEDNVMHRFNVQDKLLTEVVRETFGRPSIVPIYRALLRSEREVLRYIDLLKNALLNFNEEICHVINQQDAIKQFYQTLQLALQQISNDLKEKKMLQVLDFDQKISIKAIVDTIQPLAHSTADKLSVDLFVFAAENLFNQLKNLQHLIKKI